MRSLLLLFFLTTAAAAQETTTTPRIAVLGGGASGLSAAHVLRKQGYSSVQVFEKEELVGGVADTFSVEGNFYDLATMFVPGGSLGGAGIEPTLQELIDLSGEKLVPAVDFDRLQPLPAELQLTALPEPLRNKYEDVNILMEQLYTGLLLGSQYLACVVETGQSCTECGVCQSEDETLLAWAERNQIPAYGDLQIHTFDYLGAGPATTSLASTALLGAFGAVDVVYVLKQLDFELPDDAPPNLVSLFEAQRWYFFERGYETFWNSLVEKTQLPVMTNASVSSLVRDDSTEEWVVTVNEDSEYRFDHVVITTPPSPAVKFLPDGRQKSLLETETLNAPPNDVYLAPVRNYSLTGLPNQAAWFSEGFGLGSLDLVNATVGGTSTKCFFWQKRHAGADYMVVATYTLDPTTTTEQAWAECQDYAVHNYGITLGDYLRHRRYLFPAAAADPIAWAAEWATLQGQDNLVFTGEAFSGSGVPAVTFFASSFLPTLFPAVDDVTSAPTPATVDDGDSSSGSAVSSFHGACVAAWWALFLFWK